MHVQKTSLGVSMNTSSVNLQKLEKKGAVNFTRLVQLFVYSPKFCNPMKAESMMGAVVQVVCLFNPTQIHGSSLRTSECLGLGPRIQSPQLGVLRK